MKRKNLNAAKLKDFIIHDPRILPIYLRLKSVLSKNKVKNSFLISPIGLCIKFRDIFSNVNINIFLFILFSFASLFSFSTLS